MRAGERRVEYNGNKTLIERVAGRLGVEAEDIRQAILAETTNRKHDVVGLTVRRGVGFKTEKGKVQK